MTIEVHHCPRCELRFRNVAELRDHFDHDHHADPETFRRYRYGKAGPSQERSPSEPRFLLVANQTLHDDQLHAAVAERAGRGSFVVLVPATHSAHLAAPLSIPGEVAEAGGGDDVGLATAKWRLRTTIDRLAQAGVAAEGRLGHPDPYRAVTDLVAEQDFAEIILSTLPRGISRWLQADLPTRLQRHRGIPVTTLTAEPAAGARAQA
jgi:hypothetical protein